MEYIRELLLLGFVTFVVQYVWEKLHISLYKDYEKLGTGWRLTLMATLGDVMYVMLAVLFVSLAKQDMRWLYDPTVGDYGALALLGCGIALFVEYKALALRRWVYTARMPRILGVGISPILQMTLLLPLSLFLVHLLGTLLI